MRTREKERKCSDVGSWLNDMNLTSTSSVRRMDIIILSKTVLKMLRKSGFGFHTFKHKYIYIPMCSLFS